MDCNPDKTQNKKIPIFVFPIPLSKPAVPFPLPRSDNM